MYHTWVSGPTPSNGPPFPICMGGGSEYIIQLLCTGGVSALSTEQFKINSDMKSA